MRHDHLKTRREHHPQVGIGLFFIVLGLALLVATNDMLNLGGIKEYFTWETILIFIGALMLLNLQFVPGVLLLAVGIWFTWDNHYEEMPKLIKTIYWPVVIMILGFGFIISSFFKRRNANN